MSIHEEKVHADLEIFDDDLPALATKALDRGGTLAPAKTTSVSLAAEPVVEAISNEKENDLISDAAANDVSVHLGSTATHGTNLKWGPELTRVGQITPPDDDRANLIIEDEIELGLPSMGVFSFGAGAGQDDTTEEFIVDDETLEPEVSVPLDLLRIHVKAARLVAMLPRSQQMQRIYTRKLVSVLSAFPHHSSVLAIERMLSRGTTVEFIEDCAAIKSYWAESPHLWLSLNLKSRLSTYRFTVQISRNLRNLSWTTAEYILNAHPLTDALALIETDWVEDWRKLHKGQDGRLEAEALSYPTFLRNRPAASHMVDPNDWPYEEPSDTVAPDRMERYDRNGNLLWRFDRHAVSARSPSMALSTCYKPPYSSEGSISFES